MDKISIGRAGEDEAARVLKKNGYRLLAKNYRCRQGEVDIIAMDGDVVAFIEVKTRGNTLFGSPEEGVDARKRRRIIIASEFYLNENGLHDSAVRYDVVGVKMTGGKFAAEIIKDAFGEEG